jgi:hypothetical protein
MSDETLELKKRMSEMEAVVKRQESVILGLRAVSLGGHPTTTSGDDDDDDDDDDEGDADFDADFDYAMEAFKPSLFGNLDRKALAGVEMEEADDDEAGDDEEVVDRRRTTKSMFEKILGFESRSEYIEEVEPQTFDADEDHIIAAAPDFNVTTWKPPNHDHDHDDHRERRRLADDLEEARRHTAAQQRQQQQQQQQQHVNDVSQTTPNSSIPMPTPKEGGKHVQFKSDNNYNTPPEDSHPPILSPSLKKTFGDDRSGGGLMMKAGSFRDFAPPATY